MKPKDESYWINVMTSNMSKYARITLLRSCKKLEKMTGVSLLHLRLVFIILSLFSVGYWLAVVYDIIS